MSNPDDKTNRDDLKKLTPKQIAERIAGQKVSLADMGSLTIELPHLGDQFPTYEVSMKDFVTKVLPMLRGGETKLERLAEKVYREKDTGFDQNYEEELAAYALHAFPFADLWDAIEKVKKNGKLTPDDERDKDALRKAPKIIGKLIDDRQSAIENWRTEFASPTMLDAVAHSKAGLRAILDQVDDETRKSSPKYKITADDYKSAAEAAEERKQSMEHFDNSPNVLSDLQGDILAMNRQLGLNSRSK